MPCDAFCTRLPAKSIVVTLQLHWGEARIVRYHLCNWCITIKFYLCFCLLSTLKKNLPQSVVFSGVRSAWSRSDKMLLKHVPTKLMKAPAKAPKIWPCSVTSKFTPKTWARRRVHWRQPETFEAVKQMEIPKTWKRFLTKYVVWVRCKDINW